MNVSPIDEVKAVCETAIANPKLYGYGLLALTFENRARRACERMGYGFIAILVSNGDFWVKYHQQSAMRTIQLSLLEAQAAEAALIR